MSDYDELDPLYSEACQAFVLRDFETTSGIVDSLLERIERDGLGRPTPPTSEAITDLDELVRRVWILEITLLASSDQELVRNPKQAERELAGLHSRIERFYTTKQDHPAVPSSSSSTSTVLIHPSLLVAISLAGLKLEIPQFVRRTLQDYFRVLVSHASSEAALSSSQGDVSVLDTSQADLSLSGIAVNGHVNAGVNSLNGTNGHPGSDTNGTSAPPAQPQTTSTTANRIRSLHRLARIYSVHLLGKSFGEWSAARTWIREQADDDAAVAAGLISDSYAQTLLETLEETKRQLEEEESDARQTEKRDKERQAELLKKSKQRSPIPSSSQPSKSGTLPNSNGQAPPVRPERSKDRTQGSTTLTSERSSGNASQGDNPSSSLSRRNNEEQETGFSAFRSRISSFLSTDPHSSLSNSSSSNTRDISYNNTRNIATFDLIRIYLSRIIHSRLLKFILAFFIITGFWRRRLARSGSNKTSEIGRNLIKLKDKVLETVKMGGSLGFL